VLFIRILPVCVGFVGLVPEQAPAHHRIGMHADTAWPAATNPYSPKRRP
jgi:hypothetical protein